ncbi:hypothetical protein [Rhizobium oryziradicis]|uniref:Uncharacterized protein n=1 Tax=Rhizobium oryziradicis TaxID=1867956 RepID=A0A1Q8ZQT3_9HYPH|nr:hypothetical protein [Rhizobium oryziradicis]OLP44444.1 hypothetical protein BJF95_07910 [Rhizobium oryziradicis]
MKITDRFLAALGAWQRGWKEDPARRLAITKELEEAVAADDLPAKASTASGLCYRKRFLVPTNPQNGGDLAPLFLTGRIEEGVASWTSDPRFAQDFKDPLREGTFSAIFARAPRPDEVVVNIQALWDEPDFRGLVENYAARSGENADALLHFKSRQSEVILRVALEYDDLVGLCGKSSPFEILCELEGLTTDEQRDHFWKRLIDENIFPEEPKWLQREAVQRVLDRTKKRFLDEWGHLISK